MTNHDLLFLPEAHRQLLRRRHQQRLRRQALRFRVVETVRGVVHVATVACVVTWVYIGMSLLAAS